ncbi:hypothetical protein DBV23_17205 [Edwardsiella ictaluri]|nr:hypothetical protein DBV23_17205 [Edwardsiella ictaluri]QPW28615.1 hypothetical protein F8539_09200 [Edwardsiella ictaluri]WJH21165.1 hypothetical protein FGU63_09210 [Edwardsiella ictaluri]
MGIDVIRINSVLLAALNRTFSELNAQITHLGVSLTVRNYDSQVTEALAMLCVLNKMTRAGMPDSRNQRWGCRSVILFI